MGADLYAVELAKIGYKVAVFSSSVKAKTWQKS